VPSIQVKDVPGEAHATLRQRAAAAGQPLQEYLRGRLITAATTPTIEEVLARAGQRAGGRVPLRDAVKAVRTERDARDRLLADRLVAPHLIDAARLEEQRAGLARSDLRSLAIERVPHVPLLERIWELGSRARPALRRRSRLVTTSPAGCSSGSSRSTRRWASGRSLA